MKKRLPSCIFSLVWQIIELAGLLFSIPVTFIFGILFTGDSYTVFDFVNTYLITSLAILFIIKLIVFISFCRDKLWPIYFNLIQNIILAIVCTVFIILSIFSDLFSLLYIFFLLIFLILIRANYSCLISFKKDR